ncbi:short-chain dehydrogenase/reductase family 42E member 1 isoform X1 [Aplysia californica]|uniref:Short-chain dehydrogenase/reductase family 42E member 1 isoform X1 n=1 Tax=Aplysia californica TaxID=6500 RepID=A0ABM1A2J8_APLCA|nr:short-chain dehydrogenase/reductase family 42E member 1 isoform X1 [Aplysia californica]
MVQTRSSAQSRDKEIHVVTGGGGFPGFSLAKYLARKGHHVKLIDVKEPVWDLEANMEFIKGSICDDNQLQSVVEGASAVYHMASYGMSGREQLNKKLIEKVNIGGTEAVLKACLSQDVTRLVYTSTYNVVFGGQEILDGDERLPYLTDDKFTDHYSKTKMLAEKKVLASNGAKTSGGATLRCCVLRLAGVYGPGELRHLPRIVSYLEQGLVKVTYGPRESLVDFLHVDNLVQAHALAAEGLTEGRSYVAAGRAYFISDDKPVNNFEFFRPLFEGLGYGYPAVNLPFLPVFYFAWLTEIVHYIVSTVYNFQPILTRTEVYKTGVTHYFSVQRARTDLGYSPTVQNDLSQVVTYYKKLGRVKGHQSMPLLFYFVNAIIIFIIYSIFMHVLPRVTTD